MPNAAWPRLLPGSLCVAQSPKLGLLLFPSPKPRPLCTAAGHIRGPGPAAGVCSWCRVPAPSLPLPEPDWGPHVAPDRSAQRVRKRGWGVRGGEAWPDPGGLRAGTARPPPARQAARSRAQTMSPEEWTYLVVLLISIPIGFLFKKAGPGLKRWGAAAVGLGLTLFTCGPHTLHSLVTILGTWALVQAQPCSCHALALAWTFSYLLFFRALSLLGLPTPTPFTNAVQLLLTLKLVSLASEVQDLHLAQRKELASGFSKGPSLGLLPDVPSLMDTLSYSYCYVGIMTGPFFRYRTYLDWLEQPFPGAVPSLRPLLRRAWPAPLFGLLFLLSSHLFPLEAVREDAFYARPLPARLFYMIPVFFAFRMRFYVAWIVAECGCIAAGFGAYPVAAKARAGGGPTLHCPPPSSLEKAAALEYDYETVRNIDCYGTDFCVRVRDGMRYWNMTVQWWLAQYIYKSAPARSYVLRSAWTMLLSAYWHGLHPGYYLSFLTIPLCLAAEGRLESALRGRFGPGGQRAWDWVHWFLKMRAYDYMSMGFVLLSLGQTLRYWASIYFCIHVLALVALGLGLALGGRSPSRRKTGSQATSLAPEKLREE